MLLILQEKCVGVSYYISDETTNTFINIINGFLVYTKKQVVSLHTDAQNHISYPKEIFNMYMNSIEYLKKISQK